MPKVLSKTWVKALAIGCVSFSAVVLASQSRFLKLIELKGLDFKFFLRGFLPGDSRIFLIGIDDLSIHTLGRWPWPRSHSAALLERLSRRPPSALGFDILFNLPDESHPQSDEALSQVSRLFDQLTFAAYLQEGGDREQGRMHHESWKDEVLKKNELVRLKDSDLVLRDFSEIEIPMEGFSKSSHFGMINAPRDPDGSVRKIPLIFRFEKRVYPSFALRLVMDYYNLSGADVEWVKGPQLRLRLKDHL